MATNVAGADPTSEPTSQPSGQPSGMPSSMPSGQPSGMPSSIPSGMPSRLPSGQPSGQPSGMPSAQPSGVPSSQPSSVPSSSPTQSAAPTISSAPTPAPTLPVTSAPTMSPTTAFPTQSPLPQTDASLVDMRITQRIQNSDYTAFREDIDQAKYTVAQTVVSSVSLSVVTVPNVVHLIAHEVSTTPNSRRLAGSSDFLITYHVQTSLGDSSIDEPQIAYSLMQAVTLGNFTSYLRSYAATNNCSYLTSANSTDDSYFKVESITSVLSTKSVFNNQNALIVGIILLVVTVVLVIVFCRNEGKKPQNPDDLSLFDRARQQGIAGYSGHMPLRNNTRGASAADIELAWIQTPEGLVRKPKNVQDITYRTEQSPFNHQQVGEMNRGPGTYVSSANSSYQNTAHNSQDNQIRPLSQHTNNDGKIKLNIPGREEKSPSNQTTDPFSTNLFETRVQDGGPRMVSIVDNIPDNDPFADVMQDRGGLSNHGKKDEDDDDNVDVFF